jgi:hypothetical protein
MAKDSRSERPQATAAKPGDGAASFDAAAALAPFAALSDAAMSAWTRSSQAWFKGVAEVNRQLVASAEHWLADASEMPRSVRDQNEWEGAVKFAGSATERYIEDAARTMALVTDLVGHAAAPWAEFYARTAHDALKRSS